MTEHERWRRPAAPILLGENHVCAWREESSAIRELLAITALRQEPDADFTTTVKTVEEWAGVEVKG
jgi:hypothetical protein